MVDIQLIITIILSNTTTLFTILYKIGRLEGKIEEALEEHEYRLRRIEARLNGDVCCRSVYSRG